VFAWSAPAACPFKSEYHRARHLLGTEIVSGIRAGGEGESGKLRKLVPDLSLDKAMPRTPAPQTVRPSRKRELAAQLCREWGVSIRRAFRALESNTSTTTTGRAAAIRPI
jgi:hypothetical protein